MERLRNIATRVERCQVLPTTDPGAALLGDYAFVPGPPPPARPDPTALAASIRAGDLLPGLLWPDDPRAPPSLAALQLPPERASKLGSVRTCLPPARPAPAASFGKRTISLVPSQATTVTASSAATTAEAAA